MERTGVLAALDAKYGYCHRDKTEFAVRLFTAALS